MASIVNSMALLTVEVIQEAGVEADGPKLSRSLANDEGIVGIDVSKGPSSQTK